MNCENKIKIWIEEKNPARPKKESFWVQDKQKWERLAFENKKKKEEKKMSGVEDKKKVLS